jgi:selenocysteine lyase/cysteine desulfurase
MLRSMIMGASLVSAPVDLRAEFPVLETLSYLNAGTNGPVPRRALEAAEQALRREAREGRGDGPFFEALVGRLDTLRARVARLMRCDADELAITGSTTDGVNSVVAALDLRPGDEVLTTDEEHPGVLAPLAAARERRGIEVRVAPFAEVAEHVSTATRLVACSHVSWVSGRIVDTAALAASDAEVLLDGAQGLGAIPLDVRALGCDFYAASGQKWLCGPGGLGYLHVRSGRARELVPPWPGYGALAGTDDVLAFELHPGTRRLDNGFPPDHHAAWALAALDVLEDAGGERVQARAAELAERLAAELGERVVERDRSTLVTWRSDDPDAEVERLRAEGIVIRRLPARPYVRASVGGWSSEDELDRLAKLVLASRAPSR